MERVVGNNIQFDLCIWDSLNFPYVSCGRPGIENLSLFSEPRRHRIGVSQNKTDTDTSNRLTYRIKSNIVERYSIYTESVVVSMRHGLWSVE